MNRISPANVELVISSDPLFDIVIAFEPEVVEGLKESIWHPKQKLEDLPEGPAHLTLPLNSTLEVKPWILSRGPLRTYRHFRSPHGRNRGNQPQNVRALSTE